MFEDVVFWELRLNSNGNEGLEKFAVNALEQSLTGFLKLIGVASQLHANRSSTFQLAPGEGPKGHPSHRVEIDRTMFPKAFVFLGDERLDKVGRHFLVVDQPSIGSVEKADFLAIGVLQNLAVAIMDFSPGRHFNDLLEVISASQTEVDYRKDEANHQANQANGQTDPEGPSPIVRQLSGEKPDEAKRSDQEAEGIDEKMPLWFFGSLFLCLLSGLFARGHGFGRGLAITGVLGQGHFRPIPVHHLIIFETRGPSQVDKTKTMKTLRILTLFVVSSFLATAAPLPKSLGELKELQVKVQNVVKTRTAATVSLVSTRNGASGSGVIVSADGLILTAAHVIAGSSEMTVIFPDGRQAKAKVLGANFTRDAAMARLVGKGPWPFAEVGDSNDLSVGDFVVAMGHPKGYDPTRRPPVRFGRVMTKGGLDFVTTDCTLIGGDSGGPLFDLQGRVVGIHSNIGPDRQINNHAGLAGFKRSWDQMLAGKSWGRLGGDSRDPDRPVMGIILREQEGGLVVDQVPRNSPAAKSGIEEGDKVTLIDGKRISRLGELPEAFADHLPGSEISVTIERNGKTLKKSVILAKLSDIYPNQRR